MLNQLRKYRKQFSIGLFIIIFGVSFKLFLYDYTSKIIGEFIFELIQLSARNELDLTADDFEFAPFDRTFTIKNLSVKPSPGSSLEKKNQFEVNFPSFKVQIESFLSIYFNKSLSITGVSFDKPHIKIRKEEKEEIDNVAPVTFEISKMYQVISKYLDELSITYFDLNQGKVEFYTKNEKLFNIGNVSLLIENFSLDSGNLWKSENIFNTDKVILKINNQSIITEDKGHKAGFDSLYISTVDSSFIIYNFRYRNIKNPDKQDSVFIPRIALKHINYDAFFQDGLVDLGIVDLINPYIHLHPKTKKIDLRKKTEPVINNTRFSFLIDSINFVNGSVSYIDSLKVFKAENLSLKHGIYIVKPGGYFIEPSQILDRISLSTKRINFSDEDIDVSIGAIYLEGKEKKFHFEDVNINSDLKNQKFKYTSKNIIIKDFKYKKEGFLQIDSTWISNPNLEFNVLINSKRKNNQALHFGIKYINVANGTFIGNIDTLNIELNDFNLTGNKLSDTLGIDAIKRIKVFISEIDIGSPGYSGQLADFSFNGETNNLTAERVFSPFGELGIFRLYNPVYQASKTLASIDSAYIKDSDIEIEQKKKKKNRDSSKLTFSYEKIIALNNNVKIIDSTNVYEIEKINSVISRNLKVKLFDFEKSKVVLDKTVIETKSCNLDTNNFLTIRNIDFENTEIGNAGADSVILFSLLDTAGVLKYDSLLQKLERIAIYQPNIQLTDIPKRKGNTRDSTFTIIPPVTVRNGNFRWLTKNGRLKADTINIESKQRIRSNELLKSLQEITTQVDKVIYENDKISISVTNISKENNEIYLSSLIFSDTSGMKANLNKLFISNPEWGSLTNGEYIANSISVGQGNVTIKNRNQKNNDESKVSLPNIDIPFNRFRNIDLVVERPDQDIVLNKLDIELKNLKTDSTTSIKDLIVDTEINLSGGPFEYNLEKADRDIKFQGFNYRDVNSQLTISKINSTPLHNKEETMTKREFESDWIDGSAEKIVLTGFDVRRLIFEKDIFVNYMNVQGMDLYIYRDKRLPEPVNYVRLPHAYLIESKRNISIDSVHIETNRIVYNEKNNKSDELGKLHFNGITGDLTNIYSNEDSIRKKGKLKLVASGDIMDNGFFSTEVTFETLDTLGEYRMKGQVGNMDLTQLNPMMENTALLTIESGFNRSIEFEFDASHEYAVGSMKFYYENLKVKVLNKERAAKGLTAGFKSFFANTFIVNKNNPHFLFVREGDIYFERIEERSIFNYWAKSLLSGVVTSIGARSNKKEIKRLNEEAKEKLKDSNLDDAVVNAY